MADWTTLSFVIPARNEAAAIEQVIDGCRAFATAIQVPHEIVVVDDASDDATARLVQASADQHGDVRLIRHAEQRGIAETSHAGLLAARHDVICYLDGDGQFTAEAFAPLLDRLTDADFIVGWRQVRAERGARTWGSRVYNATTRLAGVPVHDVNCGFRALRRTVFARIAPDLRSRSSFYFAELTLRVQAAGGRVSEVPVPHRARVGGRPSGASPSVVVGQFLDLARHAWSARSDRTRTAMTLDVAPAVDAGAADADHLEEDAGDVPDVSLVVPVYNERRTIAASLVEWLGALTTAGLRAECVVIDDGSTDGTGDVLQSLSDADPRVRVHRQANAGHGAALLAGYRRARGNWVVQIDGDDEIGVSAFPVLWAARSSTGMAIGRRAQGNRAPVRRVVSRAAAGWVRWTTGTAVSDVNVPFRVLPRTRLREFLAAAPDALVAPNLALTVLAGVRGWDLHEVPVVERPRIATRRALGGTRLWMTVARATRESRAFRAHLARQSSARR